MSKRGIPHSARNDKLEPNHNETGATLAGIAFLFRIQQFGEARVFLKEVEVFVVAGVVTVGRTKLDSHFEIGESRVGFAGETVEGGESVVDMISFGGELAGFLETLASFVPAAKVHHGDATLIMVFGRFGILIGDGLHALLGNAEMGAGAIGQFPAGAGNDLLQLLFGALEFLLVEEGHGLFVELHLSLDLGVDQLDATTLGNLGR